MKRLLIGGGLIYGIATIITMILGGINFPLLFLLIICAASIIGGFYLYIKKDKD
jgi:Trk-type K+ transport system membrane component